MSTFEEVRDQFQIIKRTTGGVCPCCGGWAKIYCRDINGVMAKGLVWLTRAAVGDQYVNVPKSNVYSMVVTNQHPTLAYWGLIERPAPQRLGPKNKQFKKFEGYWRATKLGRDWVDGFVKIPSRVWTDKGGTVIPNPEGYVPKMVTIEECFDTPFDYSVVMGTQYDPEPPADLDPKPKPRKPKA